jgi:hypothetical protein
LRANVGGATQLDYAGLVDLHTGEVVWFNVVRAGSEVPGSSSATCARPRARHRWSSACWPDEAGDAVRAGGGEELMCARCFELSRRSLLLAAGRRGVLRPAVAEARILPKDMVPLVGPGYRRPRRTSRASGS